MAGDLSNDIRELRRAVLGLTDRVEHYIFRLSVEGQRLDTDALGRRIAQQQELIRLALAASDPAQQHALLLDMARLWELPEARGTAPGGHGPDDS
jgi:hypothetical protein